MRLADFQDPRPQALTNDLNLSDTVLGPAARAQDKQSLEIYLSVLMVCTCVLYSVLVSGRRATLPPPRPWPRTFTHSHRHPLSSHTARCTLHACRYALVSSARLVATGSIQASTPSLQAFDQSPRRALSLTVLRGRVRHQFIGNRLEVKVSLRTSHLSL